MGYETCQICGKVGFKSFKEYDKHHKASHNVKAVESNSSYVLIDPSLVSQPQKVFKPLEKAVKLAIVEKTEAKIRSDAWFEGRLNPLLGTTEYSSEPIWDKERNLL